MKKAVILLSGGMDSTTCLAVAKNQGYECYTLGFNYGQKHYSELEASQKVSKQFGAKQHEIVKLDFGNLAKSALTDENIKVTDYKGDGEIPVTYVPARNTLFLSIATGWAESLGASAIFIGVSAIDYSGYPDCRPDFIKAFQEVITQGTKCGVEGNPIKIETPLIHLSKAETILLGKKLGVDYSQTITCYRANEQGKACGTCDSCELRKQGFKEAGIPDETIYW